MNVERAIAAPTLLIPMRKHQAQMNLFRTVILLTLATSLIAGSPAPATAQQVFFDRDAFLAATEAKLATPNDFPNLGLLGSAPYQNGEVIYEPVGSGRLDLANWTTQLPIDAGG